MFKSLSSLLKNVDEEENYENLDIIDEDEDNYTSSTGRSSINNFVLNKNVRNTQYRTENNSMIENENRPAVAVVKIDSLNAANLAAEALREGKTVICNYEEIDPQLAQRASDFIRGAATVLHAKFCPVSHKITVFVPSGVSLISELKDKGETAMDYHEDLYNQLYMSRQ